MAKDMKLRNGSKMAAAGWTQASVSARSIPEDAAAVERAWEASVMAETSIDKACDTTFLLDDKTMGLGWTKHDAPCARRSTVKDTSW